MNIVNTSSLSLFTLCVSQINEVHKCSSHTHVSKLVLYGETAGIHLAHTCPTMPAIVNSTVESAIWGLIARVTGTGKA